MRIKTALWAFLLLQIEICTSLEDLSFENKEEINALRDEIGNIKKQITELQEENADEKRQILELKEENAELRASLKRLEDNLEREKVIQDYAQEKGFGSVYNVNERNTAEYEFKNDRSLFNNWENTTLLHVAALEGDVKALDALLLTPWIDVNAKMSGNFTPLHAAAQNGRLECVKKLLSHPHIDVNAVAEMGFTPLISAANARHLDCFMKILRREDVDVNAKFENGKTVIFFSNVKMLEALIEDGRADLTIIDNFGNSLEDVIGQAEEHVKGLSLNDPYQGWLSEDLGEREKQKNKTIEELQQMRVIFKKHTANLN